MWRQIGTIILAVKVLPKNMPSRVLSGCELICLRNVRLRKYQNIRTELNRMLCIVSVCSGRGHVMAYMPVMLTDGGRPRRLHLPGLWPTHAVARCTSDAVAKRLLSVQHIDLCICTAYCTSMSIVSDLNALQRAGPHSKPVYQLINRIALNTPTKLEFSSNRRVEEP